uniref:Beclin 1-associated autophagy-related key regulator n=1 Tax=Ciona intestinalis TaxID=7719 RepID=H2XJZ7_CIOIN|nr:beclin 1-associated autophagy-related key regulator [Ciona intestinalis]|eukprot:XP_002129835.1 beclin 1-associated autophagy-related key regulator [Ciona intestinalis]
MDTRECEDKNGATSSINIIYDRCYVCGDVGKALACQQCMNSENKGFLILTNPSKVTPGQSNLGKYMYLSRDIQEKIETIRTVLHDHEELITRSSQKVQQLSEQTSLKVKISHCSQNIERLKKLLLARKIEMKCQQNVLAENKKSLMTTRRRISKISQKKLKMKEYIRSRQESIEGIRKKEHMLHQDLQTCRLHHVTTLIQYIFPIEEVKDQEPIQSEHVMSEGMDDEMDRETALLQEELDEARRLSFLHGRWVDQKVGGSDVVQISVGETAASAPSDGDYSAYETWLDKNQTIVGSDPATVTSSMTSSEDGVTNQNPARKSVMSISAALCHAAQLVHIIRKILCVHLPHKLHYRTFCNPTISATTFSNCVKLLNSNLVSLCLQQGVDGFSLHPLHTLRNLQILIDKLKRDGVRTIPFIPTVELLLSVEETLGLGDVIDDVIHDDDSENDAEWTLSFEADWESVPAGDFNPTLTVTLPAYTSTNTQSTLMTQPAGLVTSALAWATKGWWGQNE